MNATINRCNLCGCIGGHQSGCSNRQGSGFTQSVYSYGTKPAEDKRVLRDLLDAAEEMFKWTAAEERDLIKWKAAIDAARNEMKVRFWRQKS